MARNAFAFGPMGVAPDQTAQDPKSTADALASRHQVPANVLLALKEAGSPDLDADAADLATALKSGATLDQALGARLGDPARASAVLNRAYDIADELYPRPAEPKGGGVISDTARTLGGSLVQGAGAFVKGLGIAAEEAATGGRGLPDGESPTWVRQGADALGEVVQSYGQSIKDGVSDEGRKALQESSPGGDPWRGTETAVPKVLRDLMKSYRFATEGAETLRGDPIIEEMSPWQIVMQMNGFTPAQLAERYRINNRLKNEEARIMDQRKSIHRAVGDAVRAGDPISDALLARIREFNAEFPEYPITADTIRQSVQGQIRASDRNEYGIQLNPKLNDRLRSEQPPAVYN